MEQHPCTQSQNQNMLMNSETCLKAKMLWALGLGVSIEITLGLSGTTGLLA